MRVVPITTAAPRNVKVNSLHLFACFVGGIVFALVAGWLL
jgi:hypothetical protein